MNKTFLGGAAAIALATGTALFAQAAPPAKPAPRAHKMMQQTELRTDVKANVAKMFARVDANRDGFVTEQEMTTLHGQRDGIAKVRELRQDGGDPNAAFDRMDSNHDGMISRDEFAKGRQVRVERIVMRGGPDGAGAHPMKMRMEGGHMGMMMGAGILKMADANRDGRVSLQEATTLALQHFDTADANRDGQLTPDEMRAGHMKMREIRIERKAG